MSEQPPALERLRSKKVISTLFAAGVRGGSRHVNVRFKARQEGPTRVAVISAKRLGIAVLRNRIRRRLRAAVRELDLPLPRGDVAILAKGSVVDIPFDELRRSIALAIERAVKADC